MPRLHLILLPSVLALVIPGWTEARPAKAQVTQSRPLNLSLPRDVLNAPGNAQVDEVVQRNLRVPAPSQDGIHAPPPLPYGAGYEYRHQERGGADAGAHAGGGTSSGAGRRGR